MTRRITGAAVFLTQILMLVWCTAALRAEAQTACSGTSIKCQGGFQVKCSCDGASAVCTSETSYDTNKFCNAVESTKSPSPEGWQAYCCASDIPCSTPTTQDLGPACSPDCEDAKKKDDSPPDCTDDSCKCDSNGQRNPVAGDPISLTTGSSITVENDASIIGGPYPLLFKRSYYSLADAWQRDEPVTGVPSPFGPNPANPSSLSWTHNFYSLVRLTTSVWSVREGGGHLLRFTPCSGVPCTALPDNTNKAIQERLTKTSAGFVLSKPNGQRYYYEAKWTTSGGSVDRYFLSRIETGSGTVVTQLSYELPGDCPNGGTGTDPGVPYIKDISSPTGGVRLHYVKLTQPDNTEPCVIRSVSRLGESVDLLTYTYVNDSSIERPGLVASVTDTTSAVRTYSYSSNSLSSSFANILVFSHNSGNSISDVSQGQNLTIYAPTAEGCQNGSNCCGGQVKRRRVDDSSSGLIQYVEYLDMPEQQRAPRLYREIDRCDFVGSGCASGDTRYEWECASGSTPAHVKAVKDKRNSWEAYTYALATDSSALPNTLEKTSVKKGSQDANGTGALEKTTTSYVYGPNGQQLVSNEDRDSLLFGSSGGLARTHHAYDSMGRPSATIQSGWTLVFDANAGTWSTLYRRKGTFSFTTRTGESTVDPLGRTLETHGPCWVSSDSATDCSSGTAFPITQYTYWSDTDTAARRNQLKKVSNYPSGLSNTPVETTFNDYDAAGHVLSRTDANGVETLFTYQSGQLVSETVHVTGKPDVVTNHGYDAAGHLEWTQFPEGNYEVMCYRSGTAAGAGCVGGTLTELMQWKARSSSSTGGTWSEKIAYVYHPDTTIDHREQYLDANGATRRIRSYIVDPFGHNTAEIWGDDSNGYRVTHSYDGAGNVSGVGEAYNEPPTACSSDPSTGQPGNHRCANLLHDRANRLIQEDAFADPFSSSSPATRTCMHYDAHGNLTSVDPGHSASDNCETTPPSTGATTYSYDDFGQVLEANQPNMGSSSAANVTHYEYDARGSVLTKQTPALSANSAFITYQYDAMGRMLEARHHTSLGTTQPSDLLYSLSYDTSQTMDTSCGTLENTRGRLLRRNDSFGWTWYSYDAWGRVLKEVRQRAGTTCGASTPHENPHTHYTYSPNGNLTSITYPYGRTVTYEYGTGALKDRVATVKVQTFSSSGSSTDTLVSLVAWEPYGGLRGYQTHYNQSGTHGSVDYVAGGYMSAGKLPGIPGNSGECDVPTDLPDGYSGRMRVLRVATLPTGSSYIPGSPAADILQQTYTWKFDQLMQSNTCLMGATTALKETYAYDGMVRLTGATGSLSTRGGAFGSRGYTYDSRGNLTSKSGDSFTLSAVYGSATHPDQLTSLATTQSGGVLGYTYTYDADGRLVEKDWPLVGGSPSFALQLLQGPGKSSGFGNSAQDTVYRWAYIGSSIYEYFYDSQGRRRIKEYPTGEQDEYFYDMGHQILVDQSTVPDTGSGIAYSMDEYVWLGARPIAIVRSKLNGLWQRLPDDSSNCTRMEDSASTCGVHHLVTDYLGRPVLTLDGQGRVTGTGEYDPHGYVNRVSVDVETDHPYGLLSGAFGPVFNPPTPSALNMTARFRFDAIELATSQGPIGCRPLPTPFDSLDLKDVATSTVTASLTGNYIGPRLTDWVSLGTQGSQWELTRAPDYGLSDRSSSATCVRYDSPTYSHDALGAVISAYEYQRFQTGATPFWTRLRLPGQYYDPETDLFENWNRYYDPSIGLYLEPEPLVQVPKVNKTTALQGHELPAYGYAANNPVTKTDPNGLYQRISEEVCPNYFPALELAKSWVCGRSHPPPPPFFSCGAPSEDRCLGAMRGCDICSMLEDGAGPRLDWLRTSCNGITSTSPVDGAKEVSICNEECSDITHMRDLAVTLTHEAMHVCGYDECPAYQVGEACAGDDTAFHTPKAGLCFKYPQL